MPDLKISDVEWRRVKIRLRKTFRTALGEESECEVILLMIVDKRGNVGFGEISPSPNVLGTDPEMCEVQLRKATAILKGLDYVCPEKVQEALSRIKLVTPDVVSGLDIALHDLMCRIESVPIWRKLGAKTKIVETNYTISLAEPDEMAEEAQEVQARGFTILKVKLGDDPRRDVERVLKIREVVSEDVTLRVDANQGWRDLKSALYVVKELEKLNVELIEQPLPRLRLYEHYLLRIMTTLPIILDESVRSIDDLIHCYRLDALDGVNVKLMKCGGLTSSLDLCRTARVLGLRIMIGCMLETKVSITAAAALAAAFNVDYVDLDSPLLIESIEGAKIRGGVEYQGSKIILPDSPGLGLEVTFE